MSEDEAPDRDEAPEAFTRYQNSVYRLISMAGAALVAIFGITAFVLGRTLDPAPPPTFFVIDAILTVVLFVWYLLGMRCRLDVAETWVHIASKYGDTHIDRDRVEWIDADRSVWGALQWSGRPLLIRYRTGSDESASDEEAHEGVDEGEGDTDDDEGGDENDRDGERRDGGDGGADADRPDTGPVARTGKSRTRKAFGCLPNDQRSQHAVVAELQRALGRPEDAHRAELEAAIGSRLAAMGAEGDAADD